MPIIHLLIAILCFEAVLFIATLIVAIQLFREHLYIRALVLIFLATVISGIPLFPQVAVFDLLALIPFGIFLLLLFRSRNCERRRFSPILLIAFGGILTCLVIIFKLF